MNENTNFATMLKMIWDMPVPFITVEDIGEKVYSDGWSVTHHIVVPSGKDKVVDICFVDGRLNEHLVSIKQLDMGLMDAITEFGKRVIASQGGKLTLHSN